MKALVIPLLILLIATQAFSKWIVLLEYNMNKDYFAKVLCENKKKAQLECNGKCAMVKKMAEDEKQESFPKQNRSSKLKFADVAFPFESTIVSFIALEKSEKTYSAKDTAWKGFNPLCSVFHPPTI